jgi:hypothetical protein
MVARTDSTLTLAGVLAILRDVALILFVIVYCIHTL